jgi:hypothetical protein
MTQHAELGVIARTIIDENLYMTLATADESGLPWASPVYYASEEYSAFYWVSAPEATHSRNLAVRPQASIVIFDSHTPINADGPCTCRRSSTYPPATTSTGGSGSSRGGRRRMERASGRWRTSSRRPGFACTARPRRSTSCSAPMTGGFR